VNRLRISTFAGIFEVSVPTVEAPPVGVEVLGASDDVLPAASFVALVDVLAAAEGLDNDESLIAVDGLITTSG
jgi:hypothetical protein